MTQSTLAGASLRTDGSAVGATLGAGLSSGPVVQDFEQVYRDARGDAARVPWADLRPNTFVEEWLNRDACTALRPGARVAVTGCGLGDDVALFAERGYDVLGIDLSPTAVEWARQRFPNHAGRFESGDLTDLPSRLARRFDLVVEAYTLQSVPFARRAAVAAGIASLVRPHGALLAVCRTRDEDAVPDPAGPPPYPLSERELRDLMQAQGLSPACDPCVGPDADEPSVMRLRLVFRRSPV